MPVLFKTNFVGYNGMWVTLLPYFDAKIRVYRSRFLEIFDCRIIVKGLKFSYSQFLWVTSLKNVKKMWVICNKHVYNGGDGIKFTDTPFK